MILRSMVCCLALAATPPAEAAAGPRAPSGKWHVNFDEAQCIASRNYGEGGSPQLILKAPALGEVMQVAVLRNAPRTTPEQVDATVAIGQGRPLRTGMMMFTPEGLKERVYLLNMPSPEFATVRQAKTLSIRSAGLNETFALSGMEPLMKVMDRCVADLRRVFNIAAQGAEPAGLQSRARGNLAKLFSSDDYPAVARRNRQSGRVQFALLVQEDGRVADCTIVQTSGVPSLDAQACAMLKIRAKFEPARGHDGKPAKDALVGAIVWRMP
ncbi:MAG TPA: energy transducer TonB [Allosphingosinicella sp.]|jgi:TonB family protein